MKNYNRNGKPNKQIGVKCIACSKTFLRGPLQNGRRYHSEECKQRYNRPCERCKKPIHSLGGMTKFCKECLPEITRKHGLSSTHKQKAKIQAQLKELELDYSHYKDPLTPVKDGYGFLGTLAHTKDGEYVQCHICGELHRNLAGHTYGIHGIRAKEYKQRFRLSNKTGLVSPNTRKELQKQYRRHYDKHTNFRNKLWRDKHKNTSFKMSLETDNKRGTCPDQTKQKIVNLANKLGHAPTPREYRQEYDGEGGYSAVIRHFGSWEEAMIACDLQPRGKIKKDKFNKQALLDHLRSYYQKYNRVPKNADHDSTDELPVASVYRKRFGSLNRARIEAGIPILVPAARGMPFVETMNYSLAT